MPGLKRPSMRHCKAAFRRQVCSINSRCKCRSKANQAGTDTAGSQDNRSEEDAYREFLENLAADMEAEFADLPLDHLRREGELGWGFDPAGPIGPEKVDNVYNKVSVFSDHRNLGAGANQWTAASVPCI